MTQSNLCSCTMPLDALSVVFEVGVIAIDCNICIVPYIREDIVANDPHVRLMNPLFFKMFLEVWRYEEFGHECIQCVNGQRSKLIVGGAICAYIIFPRPFKKNCPISKILNFGNGM